MTPTSERPRLAATLMIAGMALIPVGDTFGKLVMDAVPYSPELVTWARFVVGVAVVAPVLLFTSGLSGTTRWFWPACVLRGTLIALTIVFILNAIERIPLALAFGSFFIGPGVATILARFALKEAVRRVEWLSVALGFVGVLIVIRPVGELDPGVFYAIASGFFYGVFNVATRWTRPVGPAPAQLLGQLVVGAVVLLPVVWSELQFAELAVPHLLLGSGVASVFANLFSIMAYQMARAALLTPLIYLQLVSATALTLLVFGDQLDLWAYVGLATIVAAGLMPLSRIPGHGPENSRA